jgi:hypothetical protein
MPSTAATTIDLAHSFSSNRLTQCCQVCKPCYEFENRVLVTCTPPKYDDFSDKPSNLPGKLLTSKDLRPTSNTGPIRTRHPLIDSTIPRGSTPPDVADSSERGGGRTPISEKSRGARVTRAALRPNRTTGAGETWGGKRRQAGALVNEVDNRRGSTPSDVIDSSKEGGGRLRAALRLAALTSRVTLLLKPCPFNKGVSASC